MSHRNPNVSAENVIPSISPIGIPDIFGHSDARFAVGQIAEPINGTMPLNGYEKGTSALAKFSGKIIPGFEGLIHPYGLLRANVYIDQTRMLGDEVRNSKGEEWDSDDARSFHFVTVERLHISDPLVRNSNESISVEPDENGFIFRLPNCMRMIVKSRQHNQPLPIEQFFPDARYPEGVDGANELCFPAQIGAIELSRKIAEHEYPRVKISLSDPMFMTATKHTIENNLGPAFATIEDFYKKLFIRKMMPLVEIAPPRYVGEYADDNLGVEFNYLELAKNMGIIAVSTGHKTTQPFVTYGKLPTLETAA